jgi:phosphate:Na+ symporter
MLQGVRSAILNKDRQQIEKIGLMDNKVDVLDSLILKFLSELRREKLTEQEGADHQALMTATVHLENLADVIKSDLASIANNLIENDHQISDITQELFQQYYIDVCQSAKDAVAAISENDQLMAEKVINKKEDMKRYEDKIMTRKSSHLGSQKQNALQTARMEMSLVESLYRIYTHARGVAKVVLPAAILEAD